MYPEPLVECFAKTERSISQINDLQHRLNEVFQEASYEATSELNPEKTALVHRFRLTSKIPKDVPVRIGEVLHNLRSPLDQLLAAVATLHGRSETKVAFPFGESLDHFEAELSKQKKLPADALDIIRATKPYKGGNDLLWALHVINKRDKHRRGLVPLLMPAETVASYIIFHKGLPLVIGCKTGKHLVVDKPFVPEDLISKDGRPTAAYDVRPAAILFGDAGAAGDDSLEFMTTTPVAEFETDFSPTFNIGFSDIGVDGQPVVAVLNDFRQLVERILLTFRDRFFV